MKNKAIFMILLILTLPIYSASVFASYNMSIEVYGNDGVSNVIKSTDTLNVKITTNAPITNNDSKYVKFDQAGQIVQFNSCAPEGSNMVCRYSKAGSFVGGKYTFTVHVKNAAQTADRASIDSYYVVAKAQPTIQVGTPNSEGNAFSFDYSAESKPCTGLSKVEVYVDNVKKQEVRLSGSECTKIGTINLTKSSLGQGRKTVCIYVRDVVDISSNPSCKDIQVDTKAGTINHAYIRDNFGNKIEYFSDIERTYSIVLNLSDDGVGFASNKVYANISTVYPGAGYDIEQFTCVQSEENTKNWICSKEITLKTSSSRTALIKINATDDAGNQAAISSKTLSINFVNSAPAVDDISTNHVVDATQESFIGKENIIRATITSQATIAEADVVATASYGTTTQTLVGTCTGATSKTCTYTFDLSEETIANPPGYIDITIIGKDVLETSFTQTKQFKVDLEKPKYKGAYMLGPDNKDYLSNGDSVIFMVNLTDAKSAIDSSRTSATFEFLGYSRNLNCIAYPRYSECSVPLNSLASGEINITGTFYDIAGNQNAFSTENVTLIYYKDDNYESSPDYTTVYEQIGTPSKNQWDLKVTSTTPSKLDRQIAEMGIPGMTFTLYSVIKYTKASGQNPQLYSTEVLVCDSPYIDTSDTSIISVGNNDEMILAMPLYPNALANLSDLNFSCNISTISIINNGKNMTLPELDSINISIPIYATQLGEMDANVQAEITKTENMINGSTMKLIAKTQKFIDDAKEICKYVNMYATFVGTIGNIKTIFDGLTLFAYTKPAGELGSKAFGKLGTSLDWSGKEYSKYANKFCRFLECKVSLTELIKKEQDTDAGSEKSINANVGKTQAYFNQWTKVCGQTYDSRAISDQTGDYDKDKLSESDKSDWQSSNSTIGDAEFMQAWFSTAGPKTSIFLSLACFCLPGIVYNMNKYRQIQCMYLSCLKQTSHGTPKYICDETKSYLECKYFYGEVFQAIPFAPIVDAIMQKIKAAMSDTATLISTGASFGCSFAWEGTTFMGPLCKTLVWVNKVGSVYATLGGGDNEPFWDTKNEPVNDICEEAMGE